MAPLVGGGARTGEDAALTHLLLVRHGETPWHAENRYAGRSDVDLNDRGRAQAVRLARWARTADLTGIWASPLHRARATARTCADATGRQVRVDERLQELDFGRGEGLTGTEMLEQFREARLAFLADPVAHHLPGGEDPRHAARRFVGCLHDIAAEQPAGRVLVVAHSTAIRLALCEVLEIPLARYRRVFPAVHNCAVTELRLSGRAVSLLQFNSPVAPDDSSADDPAPPAG